jgi:hypothetical protein
VSERLLATTVVKMESDFSEAIEMIVSEVQGGDNEGGEAGAVIKVQSSKLKVQSLEEEQPQQTEGVGKGNEIKGKWTELMKRWAGKIYVRGGDKQQQRKKMLYVGVGFMIVVLLFFGGGQVWNQRRQQSGSVQAEKIDRIVYDFNEAKAMAGLNPARSRELLTGVKQAMGGMGGEKKSEILAQIEKEWQSVWDEAAGITEVKFEELLDLSLVRDGMIGQKMAISGDKLLVLDNQAGRVAEVNAKTGAGSIVAGGEELVGARQVVTYPGRVLVLGSDGIREVGGGKIQMRIAGDETIAAAADIKMWAGNIYLLEADNDGGIIWRYQAAGDGWGAGKEWLAGGKADKLAGGSVMAIDGSIWVTDGTKVLKYSRGVAEDWGLSGLEEELMTSGLYTDENSENLYLWEKSKSRIVVVSKLGEYKKQFRGETLGQAADMVIDEKAGVGYILADGKVWRMPI